MYIDLTIKVTPSMSRDARANESFSLIGHLGTHFDVMNKEFPLEYLERNGTVFDVSRTGSRDIDTGDIDISRIDAGMFVAFYSGFIEKEAYGSKKYFTSHPQLTQGLINTLLEKQISIIGIDFAGVRRGKEHTPMDQYCADRGVFIVENLCNLELLSRRIGEKKFQAHTYPVNYSGMSGLPCRVVAEV